MKSLILHLLLSPSALKCSFHCHPTLHLSSTHRYFWRVTVQCVPRLIWSVVFVMSSTKRTGAEIMSVVQRVPHFSECSVIYKINLNWIQFLSIWLWFLKSNSLIPRLPCSFLVCVFFYHLRKNFRLSTLGQFLCSHSRAWDLGNKTNLCPWYFFPMLPIYKSSLLIFIYLVIYLTFGCL